MAAAAAVARSAVLASSSSRTPANLEAIATTGSPRRESVAVAVEKAPAERIVKRCATSKLLARGWGWEWRTRQGWGRGRGWEWRLRARVGVEGEGRVRVEGEDEGER